MFKKLLIANRGEIAVRVIKTCERLGIKSVSVYSDADKESLHVQMADEAYYIGGSRVKESYLNINNIIDVAKKANVDAIHPGYGFLSENSEFAMKIKESGIIFIGPSVTVIDQMGNKIKARNMMEAANIPVVPGATITDSDERKVMLAARKIGYPIMVKAAAGGGGIGMEKVTNEEELLKVIPSIMKKSAMFFRSSDIYLEKYIEGPRHIEAQIVGDTNGNVICLGERDCTIQRRHQKIIEESPALSLSIEGRKKLHELAIRAGKAVHYTNAGTVEFLVDEKEEIYFLEMNTRLQVEHPVTEETTGIDLVELQLNLALEKDVTECITPYKNKENHAIEARIYAEDPVRFFPSPGHLLKWRFPEMDHIRYDFGVIEGKEITPFYDPMIGKVIAKGESREAAIHLLLECMERAEVDGIKTNIPLIINVLKSDSFQRGLVTTNFVYDELLPTLK
ncbi:biotin carboxylase N-terminal domain-containing protein [Evansella sp. AB-P1]|uniref:acetyl-CoA carboxylase biotin carboxylase subunit n=1 Tax=Evansella sp. AB-P1 TaxID=3037653 RepID=UPI00241EDBD4|nr:biotin carboxylase N-terminal domain-containing protein [Evansella sp. AB-P1]MDG5786371.1 biotin carboxylase N-terminal domain-containing protein [Evansella sp. AB-P1]